MACRALTGFTYTFAAATCVLGLASTLDKAGMSHMESFALQSELPSLCRKMVGLNSRKGPRIS